MSTNSLQPIHFPDMLRNWRWPRRLNPHFTVCKEESETWLETFEPFSPKAQKAFNLCDFSAYRSFWPTLSLHKSRRLITSLDLLASLVYSDLSKDGCRVGCDLMNLFFLIDEHFDLVDTHGARSRADIVMDALRNPHIPCRDGEWVGGEVTRQFWLNAMRISTRTFQCRFIDEFQIYLDSMVQKAQDRTENHNRSIDEYFEVRRVTIGVKAAVIINEIEMNIPEAVMQNEHIVTLIGAVTDMILIANDVYSYNVEQARGDDRHNLVAIVMRTEDLNLVDTLDWISSLHDQLVEKFLDAFHQVPHYNDPELNRQVAEFTDGLGNWVMLLVCSTRLLFNNIPTGPWL
ncbi:Terpene cyclase [Mycena sanguinolenta]|uniref:Terpene synthase n=1 Tax=Mycena sanguinolenta TaxID=230812 RepID=A0A8H7CWM7_9AGAR|nr:Terpene cyclase [Mycena sanguinolenta]